MPVEPEPTPSSTKPSTNATARPTYAHLAWLRSRWKNSSSCHCGGFGFLVRATAAARASAAGRRLRCCVPLATVPLARGVAGLAVDDRLEHSFRRAAEDDRRRRILDRMVGASPQRQHRQVGALSGRQGTHLVVDSQRPRRIERREARARRRPGAPPGASPAPARRRRRRAAPRTCRTTASRPASRFRGRPASPAARNAVSGAMPQPSRAFERGQWATGTSRSASSAISASSTSTQWAQRSSGPSTGSSVATPRFPVGGTSIGAIGCSGPVPCSSHSFSFAHLGEMRADRDARARGTSGRRRASRCTARAARRRSVRAAPPSTRARFASNCCSASPGRARTPRGRRSRAVRARRQRSPPRRRSCSRRSW